MPRLLRAAVTGIGAYVPGRVMTNADFEKIVDTSDEWIVQRTGVRERHIVGEGESTATMATAAGRQAIQKAGVKPEQLDLIIVATVTPDMILPATACFVQQELGATNAAVFDVSAACSGFLYALTVGCQFVQTGMYRRVLVIGSDALSRFTDYQDRGSCILFGDAAGAVVLEPSDDESRGILYNVIHADGSGWDFIHTPAGGSRNVASEKTVRDRLHFIKMRGRDVYKFAVEKMQWLIGNCLDSCNLTVDQIDLVIPHQVNIRILQSAAEKYNFPMDKLYVNIDRYGNTSGASVPLALEEAYRMGKIGPGSTVMLIAFGAGLTWAGSVLKL
ncbi:MAG: 3-oxoacyl-(acyl-carrier-protein) synthase 3 [Planctomycetes bacterium ADurb.Bin126]|nr:MAG: 3-oxoacyl-(acyl-carrier-protein) synthase 3 [Planctomycetes bacterium ADurb.Bin126]HOD83904.1 beta-ketoacyl-ACP synthase III [Phycisphaerae bacterium]HQL75483.1 beta-ketoacyl-ACP synthase III [Phycisphaerae bacterium]